MSGHLARLGLVWTIAPFAFFSFAQTKLPNYIALELPALALLVALWFDGVVAERGRRAILVATAAVPLAIAALAASIALFARDAHVVAGARAVIGNLEWMGAIVFTSSVIAFGLLVARRTALAPYAIGAGAVLMVLYTAIVAEPHAETFKPIPQLAAIVRAQERPGDVIAIVGVAGSNALLFYTRPPVDTLGDPDSVRRAVCAAKRLYLVTSKDRAERYGSYGRHRSVVAGVRNDVLLLYDGPSCP